MKKTIMICLAWILAAGCSAPVSKQSVQNEQESILNSEASEETEKEDPKLIAFETASAYLRDGEYAKAIESFSALISEDPSVPEYYIGRAQAYLGTGTEREMRKGAANDYRSAIELDPSQADAYIGLANICVLENNYGRAAAHICNGIAALSEADSDYEERLQALEAELAKIREEGGYVEAGTVVSSENLNISDINMGSIKEKFTENNGETMYEAHLYFRVDGPENAAAVFGYISSGYGFRGLDLDEDIQTLVERYKENHPGRYSTGMPFYAGTLFQFSEKWESTQVCVIAVDENYDYVGYAVIELDPGI